MIARTCVDCRVAAATDIKMSTETVFHAMKLNMSYETSPSPPDSLAAAAIDSKDLLSQPVSLHNLGYNQTFRGRGQTRLQSELIPIFDSTTNAPQVNCMLVDGEVEAPYPKVSPLQESRTRIERTGRDECLLEIDETSLHQSSTDAPTRNVTSPPHADVPASTNSKSMMYYIRRAQERIKAQQPLRLPHPKDRLEYCREQGGIHPDSYGKRNKKSTVCERTEDTHIQLFPSPPSPSMLVSDLDAFVPRRSLQKRRSTISASSEGNDDKMWPLKAPSPSALPDPSDVFLGSGGMLGIDTLHSVRSDSSSPSCSSTSSLYRLFETTEISSVTSTESESGRLYSLPPVPSPSPKLDILSNELARFLRESRPISLRQQPLRNGHCQTGRCSAWFADVLGSGRYSAFHALENCDSSSVYNDSILTLSDAMLYERPKPKSSSVSMDSVMEMEIKCPRPVRASSFQSVGKLLRGTITDATL